MGMILIFKRSVKVKSKWIVYQITEVTAHRKTTAVAMSRVLDFLRQACWVYQLCQVASRNRDLGRAHGKTDPLVDHPFGKAQKRIKDSRRN